MKIHHLIMLVVALLLAGCVNFERNAVAPNGTSDAGNEATQEETAEVELGTKTPAPSPAAIPPPSPSPKPPAAQSTATPQAATPPPEPETPAPAETINPPPKPEPAPNLLATPEEGVLVKAPVGYTSKSLEKDQTTYDSPPVAHTVFVSPENFEYTVRVFQRRPGETLLDWGKRGNFGDAFLPAETIRTRDGNSGYVYETNDLGALPDHHITLMTEGFVYRFDWDNPRFDWNDPAETLMTLIRGREQEFFPVPEHFKQFIRNVELK